MGKVTEKVTGCDKAHVHLHLIRQPERHSEIQSQKKKLKKKGGRKLQNMHLLIKKKRGYRP